ncbi:PREDICTED: uncharacterized protein LOC109213687 [Nicotiana attenuata]|uniref:Uncharacterized protein n=1 Tax=Nicotiana attenuata TaxID=49451 RepID=A0A1J6KY87_NICAT|nr:PREDICTED: uncharacterized protein LOC109213687 [Nicotiana attenuata]OIT27635.1 hypothetical protein A4A49_21225 [Nicotiana attenuata]
MVVTQEHEEPSGWPLGLENMNIRLRVAERSQVVTAAAATEEIAYRLYISSPSFSSFSSSNLDTESTMSFFQDQSVSLGRLIGIRPVNRRKSDVTNRAHLEKNENRRSELEDYKCQEGDMTQKLCVPLLHNVLEKMSRNKSNSPKH